MERANDVLEYWIGRGPFDAARLAERSNFWFGGDGAVAVAARDAEIRDQLEPMLERAARGEFANWAASPKRRLALILLFDQVPRNAYRGSAAAFAFDREALALAVEGMHLAADAALEPLERLFFYLPLEHAESIDAQETAVAALDRLVADAPAELREFLSHAAGYAREHRDIIAKFGRFPHRNAVMGRESTPAEREWRAANGETFGQ
ncbi:MAG TPA: DUF924 family protein [Steroidobacteraceae bacterium]|jgi:uncharacterized protein (DUF924 family)|nr:DUF924 family protein [Steroidobacteraceae bacterium]